SRKQDDKTKRQAKGKSPVESFTGYRDLNVEFEDYSDYSINEVNAASTIVPTVGQISPNSTNTFSVVGPSNAVLVTKPHNKTLYELLQGEEGTQTYVLFPVLSDGSTNPKNNKDAHTDGNEHDDDIQKSVSPDIHSSSYGDQTREQGDKAENKDKGKSLVVSAAEFNFTNSTNDFSAAGPSNAAMPNLEDLSHNADDVGAEADINNMESIISVSPIPITRIHKDHPTSQIIGDLSSTTQTRSMSKEVRDQALKDPSWIEAMQEELLQFKMQKVWILVDLPYGKRAIGTKMGL
nr:hypothetical protein [Tanacetum cinerariifolium]